MADALEEIKNKSNIVDIISPYVPLKKAGVNFKALCPFHQEKTPSFMVSPEKQIWHCFGCGRGGDAISFIMEMEGLEFYDALKFLGEKVGVKVAPVHREAYSQKKQLYELNELAAKLFKHILWKTKPGERVLTYLRKRGLKDDTIDQFKLGYAPNQRDILSKFLIKNKFPLPLIVQSGLCIKKDHFSLKEIPIFDRFRGRAIFPIINQAGSIVGFSGRIMPYFEEENIAKYLNSPDSPIFNKSFVLFGLNFAKQEIIKKDYVVLVEGQMDVVSSHQAEFLNTVASSGTSLTESQLDLLRRFSRNLYFAFDKDQAGQIATERGIGLALAKDFNVYIVFVPKPFKDVDECLKNNPKKWKQALEKRKNILEYFFALYAKNAKTIEEQQEAAEKILPFLRMIKNPIVQGEWIQRLSSRLNISEPSLYEALSQIKNKDKTILKQEIPEKNLKEIHKEIEKRIIAILFIFPAFFRKTKKDLNLFLKNNPLYTIWLKFYNQKSRSKDAFLGKLKNPALPLAVLEVENDYDRTDRDLAEKELIDLLNFLKKEYKQKQIDILQEKIRICEKTKNLTQLKKLLRELQNIILS